MAKEVAAPVHRRRSRIYDLADFVARQVKRGYVGALQKVDSRPMAPPVGFVQHKPLSLQIRDMVRSEALRMAAEENDMESFEEADDFDIPDDPVDPKSPYENDYDPPIRELVTEGNKEIKRKTPAKAGGGGGTPPPEAPKAPSEGDSVKP